MTTSTIELMRAAIAGADDKPAAYLNIVAPGSEGDAGAASTVERLELTHTRWGQGLRLADDLVIMPNEGDVPLWMARLYGDPEPRPRLRPMHPDSIPTGVKRTWRYLNFLRKKAQDPETWHRYLAADTIVYLRNIVHLPGARVIDIGGQAGFISEALRDEGASCHVVEQRCASLDPYDGHIDRSVCADATDLPLPSGSFDLAHSSDVLDHVSSSGRLLDEMVRVLKPGTGIGYLAFTNGRSPLFRLEGASPHHAVSVGEVLDWFEGRDDVELVCAQPRLWPALAPHILDRPALREVATGSLRVVFRRRY